ncbi:serine/threonine protein phosphatase PrpC [Kitasatospora sp. MAP12-15]|uniref:MerR family transcriptional regulator n=1 Tax=unclassified Kitasatospora TaxID=2633591 RepID=UPI00247519C9|nr:MerR family transcriptional regulator [Kitasatospora sp. MAP12-44]MDH6109065.1 serine/threonine protein phosphatase PrpC [Kitasatospora sp. MAP12-44]
MELLTIGAFARASRLSPKALRLYDELGLLRPAEVDPSSGYRFYHPEQLERARLVAWLRRLGMPLARIRLVCELPPGQAAEEVAAYWSRVMADTMARQDLADFLVDHLSDRKVTMTNTTPALAIRYAAGSHIGLVRARNEDAAHAGPRLLAVADGFGGAGADWASTTAIDALKRLDAELPAEGLSPGELLNALEQAVQQTMTDLREAAPAEGEPGTTLTALLWSGSQLALVHIGDSRAYLLRDGELYQITHDHTHVQSLIDEGRLSADEAASHPQRSLLRRALDGSGAGRPDLSLHTARAGDRYLLCSDGLSAVVPTDRLHTALSTISEPEQAVQQLIALANRAGGPDNIACAVADVVERQE